MHNHKLFFGYIRYYWANDRQLKCNTGSLALSCYISYVYISIYFGEVYYSRDLIQLVASPQPWTSGVTLILSKETGFLQ